MPDDPTDIVEFSLGDEQAIEPRTIDDDTQLLEIWLRSKSNSYTRRNYRLGAERFLAFLHERGRTIATCMPQDVLDWRDELAASELKLSTQRLYVTTVRSLFSFGLRLGYLVRNVAIIAELPKGPDTLTERILSEAEVRAILNAATPRTAALIRFLYITGARISEACRLRWRDLRDMGDEGGVITLFGKRSKTRHVHEPAEELEQLEELRGEPDDYVFRTRTGRPLHPSTAVGLVRRAARAAGITRPVSPHWFRHSHITHAIEHGAPIHLVQATVGHASLATTGRYLHANPKESSGKYLQLDEEETDDRQVADEG